MILLLYILWCYNSRLSDKSKEESYIGFIQENSIVFLVQCIYLIFARLIVYTIQVLAYSKDHIYSMLLTYSMISFF